jgi:hypothetical protein
MDVLYERIAAIDVGKKELVVCVRLPPEGEDGERRQAVRTYGTATRDLLELRDWLTGQKVPTVVMEATGRNLSSPIRRLVVMEFVERALFPSVVR